MSTARELAEALASRMNEETNARTATAEAAREVARAAVRAEQGLVNLGIEVGKLREENAQLVANRTQLEETVRQLAGELRDRERECLDLRARVATLTEQVTEMEGHPDVVAARAQRAEEAKAAAIAAAEEAIKLHTAVLARLRPAPPAPEDPPADPGT